jgi:hypothetical protein
MPSKPELDPRRRQTIEAVATFTALMHAYERGELQAAAQAQVELAQLGVIVRFVRSKTGGRK